MRQFSQLGFEPCSEPEKHMKRSAWVFVGVVMGHFTEQTIIRLIGG